jgi:hypothetical protein
LSSYLASSRRDMFSSVSFLQLRMTLDRSVMFVLRVDAKWELNDGMLLTHVVNLNKIVAVVMVIDALYAHS